MYNRQKKYGDMVTRKFNDARPSPGKPDVRQVLSVEKVQEYINITQAQLELIIKAAIDDCELTAGGFVGPNKKLGKAEEKARNDYHGDLSRIADWNRGKLVISSAEEYRKVKEFFSSKNADYLKNKFGLTVEKSTDFFEDPKDSTNYRAINYKISLPSGPKKEPVIVELQVVAEQIEAIYEHTHKFKGEAEAIYDRIATDDEKFTKTGERTFTPEKRAWLLQRAADFMLVCKYRNYEAAVNAGYHDDEILSPNRTNNDEFNLHDKNLRKKIHVIERALGEFNPEENYDAAVDLQKAQKLKKEKFGIFDNGRDPPIFIRASLLTEGNKSKTKNNRDVVAHIDYYDFSSEKWQPSKNLARLTSSTNFRFMENEISEFMQRLLKETHTYRETKLKSDPSLVSYEHDR